MPGHAPAASYAPGCLASCLGLQGGASCQFSAIPLNLSAEGDVVDYIVTGSWSKKAAGGEQQLEVAADALHSLCPLYPPCSNRLLLQCG